jgi:hypothetical protein
MQTFQERIMAKERARMYGELASISNPVMSVDNV